MNAGKIRRVEAAEIMEEISNYSRNRGVADEASKIDVDVTAATKSEAIQQAILQENPLGDKKGFVLDPSKGEGDDLEVPEVLEKAADNNDPTGESSAETSKDQEELRRIANQFRAYCARILFFAFLTKSKVQSLEDIIACMDAGENVRIAANLRISKKVLKAIQKYFNRFILSAWDYKIANLNKLSRDESLDPLQRATTANSKFDRLGESEIVTPGKIADDMVALLPEKELKRIAADGEKILDISGKTGEFAIALYKRYQKIDPKIDVSDLILTIPTSSHAYEFTRKVYEALGLNINNIAEQFTAYDLIAVKNKNGEIDYERIKNLLTQKKPFNKITMNDKVTSKRKHMKIAAVIGNPPYQENDGGNGRSAAPIYQNYVGIGQETSDRYVSMIMPSKWYSGGKGLNGFRSQMLCDENLKCLVDYVDSHLCFGSSADVAGGVCYFLRDDEHKGDCDYVNYGASGNRKQGKRRLNEHEVFVRYFEANEIIKKVQMLNEPRMSEMVSSRKPFGLSTDVVPMKDGDIVLRYNKGEGKYLRSKISVGSDLIDKWNVMLSYLSAEHAGQPDKSGRFNVLSSLSILPPGSICTETYLLAGSFDSKTQALNLEKYLKTRFVRFLVLQIALTQHITKGCFDFVPVQDFSQEWTDKKLYDKYNLLKEEREFIDSMIKPIA